MRTVFGGRAGFWGGRHRDHDNRDTPLALPQREC
jgi:hypothetical protein